VTVIYSCQIYLYRTNLVLHFWLNGPLFLLNLNALTKFLCCKQLNGKMLNSVSSIYLGEMFLLKKLKCFTNAKTCLNSYEKSIKNAIYCKMMEHERLLKYFATYITMNI